MAQTKKTTTKKTPLQIVKEKFGEKKALVAQLVEKLERREGESKADFEKRLLKVPAQKLLTLAARIEEVAKAGGRAGLTNAIHDAVQKKLSKKDAPKEDKNLKAKLADKTLGALLDTAKAVEKKARKVAKKA